MAKTFQLADSSVNAEAAAIAALLDDGYLRIYDGDQPGTGDEAVTEQILLAELRFGAPAFGDPVAGVVTATEIRAGKGLAEGAPTWFRALQPDGTTPVFDGSVGPTNADLVMKAKKIVEDLIVEVSDLTFTAGRRK